MCRGILRPCHICHDAKCHSWRKGRDADAHTRASPIPHSPLLPGKINFAARRGLTVPIFCLGLAAREPLPSFDGDRGHLVRGLAVQILNCGPATRTVPSILSFANVSTMTV